MPEQRKDLESLVMHSITQKNANRVVQNRGQSIPSISSHITQRSIGFHTLYLQSICDVECIDTEKGMIIPSIPPIRKMSYSSDAISCIRFIQ